MDLTCRRRFHQPGAGRAGGRVRPAGVHGDGDVFDVWPCHRHERIGYRRTKSETAIAARRHADLALQYLLHPEGLGAAFHVLILGKNIDPREWAFEHNRLRRLGLPE